MTFIHLNEKIKVIVLIMWSLIFQAHTHLLLKTLNLNNGSYLLIVVD